MADLRQMIMAVRSKAQCDKIVAWVGDDPKRFDLLMQAFFSGSKEVAPRASWPVRYVVDLHPGWADQYVGGIIETIVKSKHEPVRRHGLLVLANAVIPEDYLGEVVALCFGFLQDPHAGTAVKRASLIILGKVCEREPDLADELVMVLEDQLPVASAGFVNIAKKYINRLKGE